MARRGRLHVGTSGFAYKTWKPEFYPADLKNGDMLRYYAERIPSVEINNTFYRAPTPKLLEGWTAETPASFVFTLKAPQKITHFARLKNADENLEYFLSTARTLGPRLGCILFQCPPNLRYDAKLLDEFLVALPGAPFRFAMEFRHVSWRADEAVAALRKAEVAWCIAEGEGDDTPRFRTAKSFAYLRLRRDTYDDAAIESWSAEVRAILDEGADAYVYFKHEDDPSGVRYAMKMRELCG
jgi:uncharacterized protein YecE (DUF72 family)